MVVGKSILTVIDLVVLNFIYLCYLSILFYRIILMQVLQADQDWESRHL